ncbi:MAG: hypothetical protein ABR543_05590 [Gemmatimonadaceae bacterium]
MSIKESLSHTPGVALVAALLVSAGCAPKAPPLSGAVAPVALPRSELQPGYRRIIFTWNYRDADYNLRGDGAARVSPPDSARFDFFLPNGMGTHAVLIGGDLRAPGPDFLKNLLPPPEMLWAALGRLALGSAQPADTIVRVDGDTLRADISSLQGGGEEIWRVAFSNGILTKLDLIEGGRIQEWVSRQRNGDVSYRHERAGRKLEIRITRVERIAELDETIWR